MAPHSSTLAWKIPWTEEPGRLQSTGSLRVGHDWATSLSRIGEGNGNPLQCSCLENPRDGGAWWAAVYGVAQSRTRMKWLSSSSSIYFIHWESMTFLERGCTKKCFLASLFCCCSVTKSCPTLCDPMDGSQPGSPVPGILQAWTMEWVAISFSNARKWKVKVKSLSRIRLLATPWTAAY